MERINQVIGLCKNLRQERKVFLNTYKSSNEILLVWKKIILLNLWGQIYLIAYYF